MLREASAETVAAKESGVHLAEGGHCPEDPSPCTRGPGTSRDQCRKEKGRTEDPGQPATAVPTLVNVRCNLLKGSLGDATQGVPCFLVSVSSGPHGWLTDFYGPVTTRHRKHFSISRGQKVNSSVILAEAILAPWSLNSVNVRRCLGLEE